MSRSNKALLIFSAVAVGLTTRAGAAPISAGDLVVYQVGTAGGGTLTSAAASVFLDEYTPTGNLVQSIALPGGGTGAGDLTASGSATSEGALAVSPTGQYVSFTGYASPSGTAGVVASSSARVVGILNTTTGGIDTSTALTDAYLGNNIRGAYYDGSHIYTSGTSATTSPQNASGGVRYTTLGSTSSTAISYGGTSTNSTGGTSVTTINTRAVQVVGGNIYFSSGSASNYGINLLAGTPTAGPVNATNLGVDYSTSASPYAFVFSTLPGGPANDELYVADSGGSILKYSLVGGSYVATGSFTGLSGVTGLSGAVVNGNQVLYATTPSSIDSITDTTGYDGTLTTTSVSIVAQAPTGEAFRGIALVPEPASFAMLMLSGIALLGRRRRNI